MVASNMIHCVLFLMTATITQALLYQVQTIFVDYLKANHSHIKKLFYFSDGCGGQYKNYKNFVDLSSHKYDFGISGKWAFFCNKLLQTSL